jgi:hypothetical protein
MVCENEREARRMPLELLDRPTFLASVGPPGKPEPADVPEGDEEEDEDAK